jgi:double-strand break repair protein MRE11
MVKVESLVSDFLSAQSLKVLPQGPFGDAVNQFVSKDDKHAMELFVSEHLKGQVQQMLGLESDDEDLNSAMDIYRARVEQQLASGMNRTHITERKRVLRPKPATWDSDFDGNWEDEPDAWLYEDASESLTPVTTQASGRSRGKSTVKAEEAALDDEDDEPPPPTSRATKSKAAATKAAAPKKAPAKKPPARGGRGRKAALPPSDEEDEEEDVVMESDEEEPAPPPKKRQPARRQAAAAPAASTRSTRTRQTKLDFSQSASARGAGATQKSAAVEISDDEISDEDDAFEPAPVATRTRRR